MKSSSKHKSKCSEDKMKYFNQICTEEFIEIPCTHPDIEQVVSIVVDCEIVSLKAVNTMKGLSYEGQYLSGKKLAVEIKLRQKILYVSDKHTQSVHVLENEYFQSAYVVIPCLIGGSDPACLIKNNILQCKVVVEDVFVKQINKRKLFKNLCLLIIAEISPYYGLCCAIHHNCRFSNLYIMHNDGTQTIRITNSEDYKNYKPLWSPNGRDIAFISDKHCKKMLNIYSVKLGDLRRLTSTSDFRTINGYSWSQDSARLIFTACAGKSRELFSVNTNDTGLKQITYGNGVYESYMPKCSPCGQKIAFLRLFSGLSDIWVMGPDGLDCIKLTSCGCVKYFDWSPDGNSIVFIHSKDNKPDQIFKISLESMRTEEVCLDEPIHNKKKVRFAPDGQCFAFIGSQFGSDNIFIYDMDNKRLDNITENCDNLKISDFCWNPDSDGIYLSAMDMFYYNIYLIDLKDKEKSQLTNTTASKLELTVRMKIC